MEILEEIHSDSEKQIANLIQENMRDEADAIMSYTHFLEALSSSDIIGNKRDKIESEIYEIIGDELNHQDRLKMLYSLVTNIKEAKD